MSYAWSNALMRHVVDPRPVAIMTSVVDLADDYPAARREMPPVGPPRCVCDVPARPWLAWDAGAYGVLGCYRCGRFLITQPTGLRLVYWRGVARWRRRRRALARLVTRWTR
jgi:hypothetical protein